jgi:membrane-associated protein
VLGWLANHVLALHGPLAYLIVGLLVFGEAAVLLGFVIPGETAAVVGGALAALHRVELWLVALVVVVAAIVGDSVGYEVGKLLGPWLLERRPLKDHPGVAKARALLVRFGGPAVFLGRWVALARALVPGLTGMSGMRYRTFLAFNAAGGLAWGLTFVVLGDVLGRSYERAVHAGGTASIWLVVGVVVLAIGHRLFRWQRERRRRAATRRSDLPPPTSASAP